MASLIEQFVWVIVKIRQENLIQCLKVSTLISLITVEVGINLEGVQKMQNQQTWRVGFFGQN